MGDYGAYRTDVELAKLEKRIIDMCNGSLKDAEADIKAYFTSFAERDKKMLERLNNGEISKDYYTQWRLNQIGRGERMVALKDKVANLSANALQTATDYINDEIPGIYSLNRNYTGYEISQYSPNIDFTLWDEHTVRRLLVEEPDIMPEYPEELARDRGFDLEYGKKRITSNVTKGILLGKSVSKIADDLMKDIVGMERVSAIRAARTAFTTAQNAGRQDAYAEAASLGIKVNKRWRCTHDLRTRFSHGMMDMQTVPWDKPFTYAGERLMYPGDQSLGAGPAMIYNCRCTMRTVEKDGIEAEPRQIRVRNPITGENELVDEIPYKEWIEQQKAKDPDKFMVEYRKAKNKSSDEKQYQEFKKILGKDIPKTFAEFTTMKYTDEKKWGYTKDLVKYLRKYQTSNKTIYDANLALKHLRKGILVPSVPHRAYILPEGVKDPNHIINRMLERNITDDDLRHYVDSAVMMFIQWGGARRLYVAKDGMTVITKSQKKDEQGNIIEDDNWYFKTAWKSPSDDDEGSDEIRKVLKDAGLL